MGEKKQGGEKGAGKIRVARTERLRVGKNKPEWGVSGSNNTTKNNNKNNTKKKNGLMNTG